jgi:hypothetical protein
MTILLLTSFDHHIHSLLHGSHLLLKQEPLHLTWVCCLHRHMSWLFGKKKAAAASPAVDETNDGYHTPPPKGKKLSLAPTLVEKKGASTLLAAVTATTTTSSSGGSGERKASPAKSKSSKSTFDASRIVKRPIELPTAGHEGKLGMSSILILPSFGDCIASLSDLLVIAFVLDNVYTESECKALIAATEALGYAAALVNVGFGRQKLMTDVCIPFIYLIVVIFWCDGPPTGCVICQ